MRYSAAYPTGAERGAERALFTMGFDPIVFQYAISMSVKSEVVQNDLQTRIEKCRAVAGPRI